MIFRLIRIAAALAGLALLGGAISLAVTGPEAKHHRKLPPAEGVYTALAGATGAEAYGKRTTCGQVISTRTKGVAHPVLPCGVRIYVSYGGKHVLTQVIDRGPSAPGREFELTTALARQLGLSGVQPIHWSYAGAR
jgi:rare lipoprotein A (peptidoglycan hydrolase)